MMQEVIIICVFVGLYYYFTKLQSHVPSSFDDFRDVSPEHYERVNKALVMFEEERIGRADIHTLAAHRATVSKHLNEIKFRMPNDIEARDTLQKRIDRIERDLEDSIQFIRKQRGKHLEFPYPLETYFMHLQPVILTQDRVQSPAYSTPF
jgi:hypothetical protein